MYGTSMRENREIPPSPRLLITGWAARGTQGGTPEMHERGKSDRFVVPANPPNKATAAEVGEERERAEGNTDGKTHPGPSARDVGCRSRVLLGSRGERRLGCRRRRYMEPSGTSDGRWWIGPARRRSS